MRVCANVSPGKQSEKKKALKLVSLLPKRGGKESESGVFSFKIFMNL